MGRAAKVALLLISIFLAPRAASAAEVYAGLFAHDVRAGLTVCCFEHGADIQVGVRGEPIVSLNQLGDLRPYGQVSLNTAGGVDFASAGLAWRLHLSSHIYLQPALSAAVQDGSIAGYQKTTDRLYLGSRVLFEPELALGWREGPWALEAVYLHISHAQLAGRQNPGMDDLGARIVRRF